MATLVNLSNTHDAEVRRKTRNETTQKAYYLKEYRGLDVITRAKKAAMSVSNNGKCWWIYNYVYAELTWRNPKCD